MVERVSESSERDVGKVQKCVHQARYNIDKTVIGSILGLFCLFHGTSMFFKIHHTTPTPRVLDLFFARSPYQYHTGTVHTIAMFSKTNLQASCKIQTTSTVCLWYETDANVESTGALTRTYWFYAMALHRRVCCRSRTAQIPIIDPTIGALPLSTQNG